jgi:hypothetical protein
MLRLKKYDAEDQPSVKLLTKHFIRYTFNINLLKPSGNFTYDQV